MLRFLRSTKKSLKEEEELLRAPLHNLQEIETNTVFSDRVCIKDDAFWRGLPCGLCFFLARDKTVAYTANRCEVFGPLRVYLKILSECNNEVVNGSGFGKG